MLTRAALWQNMLYNVTTQLKLRGQEQARGYFENAIWQSNFCLAGLINVSQVGKCTKPVMEQVHA